MTNALPISLVLVLLAVACQPKENHTSATKSPDSSAVTGPDTASPKDPATTFLIVPGERVGSVQASTSEADLLRRFGSSVVTVGDTIYAAEGEAFIGTTLYKGTADELQILYKDPDKRTHPETVLIRPNRTDDEGNPLPNVATTRWRTTDGIGIGTTLNELEKRNGRAFKLWGFGWDYGGSVSNWQGGNMAASDDKSWLALTLGPPDNLTPALEKAYNRVLGDSEFLSSLAPLQLLNPTVQTMTVSFRP